MEDEDGESKSVDMWGILGEQRIKDSTLGNSLKHSNDDIYADAIEEEKQFLRYNSIIASKDSPSKSIVTGPRLTFKGFKKRILAQSRNIHTAVSRGIASEQQQLARSNASTRSKDRRAEGKRERKITEYAQYLGLQPSSRYRCSKCHGWSGCGPNTKQNLCSCNPSMTPMPSTSESASLPHAASNFKITRKVYLCAACGTYFENWNLFLHMRDIHKRHICLFCLGMFGQAERLSYHLSKKHSVTDMSFTSVEDFYSAFKGSCYLVCCSCERVFSETDNFYNHFCSPALKQDAIAGMSVCTLCRQTGTHASTCSFALSSDNTDKELYDTTSLTTIATDATRADDASPATVPSPERTANLGGKGLPRKVIKNNRSKHVGDSVQNSHQQKANALTRKLIAKTRFNETQLHRDSDVHKEVANNMPRDTVSETIMEVSRYTGDSSDENDENDEQAVNKDVNRDRGSMEKSPVQNRQLDSNEPYDSVTETIMEVSRCTSDNEENMNEREHSSTCTADIRALPVDEKMDYDENEAMSDRSDMDLSHQSVSPKAPSSPVRWEGEETADKRTNAAAYEPGIEFESRSYSPQNVHSPINRSLFSPRHESHILDSQSKETDNFEDDVNKEEEEEEEEKRPDATNASDSQVSVSFNAVASTDRSLVIKITNRNSQFSVATAASRESEENNNSGEGSTSEQKIANGSSREKDVIGDDQTIDLDDSDSDSDKLAVVDSNTEEDEEAEDGEEADVEEVGHNDVVRLDNQGDSSGIETGIFAITETMPSDKVTERFDDDEPEGTKTVANDRETKNRTISDGGIVLAGEDVPCVDLNVEGTLDSIELEELLKRCIEAASPICVYCNHARQIAVNGKQLSLHMLAEHKFQPQHPAIIIHADQFIARVKRSLDELESRYFNLNTYNSENGTYDVPQVRTYECFHCRFHSAVHKELYLHNRKMHQKTILICIMCKSTFYSYSELLCHLCPGIYLPNINVPIRYRCCLCSVPSLPSAFRLMVHLRKRHHACDVCLESTGNQQRLSNHVWKHKLHHLCYRCGIAYRNKPDITKHLFWKHGTESVLCRKCLQKKWPHIYHFCIPPTAFVCEECGSSFSRAVALKVHKRLHSGDMPYGCDECTERFISRKLLAKHQASHREPEPEKVDVNIVDVTDRPATNGSDEKLDRDKTQRTIAATTDNATTGPIVESAKEPVKEAVKRVVDVYDLPPLNLSSESDTDNEDEKIVTAEKSAEKEKVTTEDATNKSEAVEEPTDGDDVAILVNDIVDVERNEEEKKQEARIMDGIWDNFKTYAASLEMKESVLKENFALKEVESTPEIDPTYLSSIVLADHDYCVVSSDKEKSGDQETTPKDDDAKKEHDAKSRNSPSPDSPNRNAECESDANKRAKVKTPKKKKQTDSTSSSDSSSDTDSSSCSCGTNCSCSNSSSGSSSGSSSSSSDSDSSTSESSPRKQSSRKDRNKKEKEAVSEKKVDSVEPENKEEVTVENGSVPEVTSEAALPPKPLLRESDLETEETDTDEDFYDEHPQLLANKLLAEKRNKLLVLATVAPASTPAQTAVLTPVEQPSTPMNNGIQDVEMTISEPITINDDRPQQKRKTKTKKRRRGERGKRNTIATNVESIKLNIPKAYYQKNPGYAASSPAILSTLHPSRSSTPILPTSNDIHSAGSGSGRASTTMEMLQTPSTATVVATTVHQNQNVIGSGSETENKRSSKRKRVPKRFYGDSSDDEPSEKQQVLKWGRKSETVTPAFAPPSTPTVIPTAISVSTTPVANTKSVPPSTKLSFGSKTVQTYRTTHMEARQQALAEQALPIAPASTTESEGAAGSSSDSSESEVEDLIGQSRTYDDLPPADNAPTVERPGKIYCYCQCPYDEVSEMIACDGQDCRIEWFHFECVGIMVPPKGKWYCPDCRGKYDIVQNNDEHCD